MQLKAARRGVQEAERFFRMTPRQVCLCLQTYGARERHLLSSLHLQAALTALAVHAPSRLPECPSFSPAEEMSWEEMKQRLLSWRRKDEP
ncbi:MAG: hypothetical protein IJO67_06630 [Clostridia bacterium]|nr:hypothetical protein [Clostridia bacterium]